MKTRSLFFLLAVFLNTMLAFAQRDPHNPDNYYYNEGCWGTINIEVGETKTLSLPDNIQSSKLSSLIWEEYLSAGYIKVISQSGRSCTIEGMTSGSGQQLWCLMEYGNQSYPYNTYKAYYLINVTSNGKLKLSASPNGGNVEKGTKVYLTTDQPNADIYYTFDNDYPSTSSTKYTSAGVTINESCTLRAIATKRGYDASERMSWTFTVVKPEGIEINAKNFPDENFRNYLLAQSYGKDDVLTDEEIKGITDLNVGDKNISNLKGIEYFTALTDLDCRNNQLTSLDVSKNTALTYLYCADNPLTSLDVSKNTALTKLVCNNDQLTSLDVSKNTALTKLAFSYNQLTSLDVSKNTALTELFCYDNQLTSLDVSKNTALTFINCSRNMIKGASMNAFIESLPYNMTNEGYALLIYDNNEGDEGNVCTKSQVEAAKAKGWIPKYKNGTKNEEYEGSDEPTSLSVSPSSKTIEKGESFTLTYIILPSDVTTTVTWSSDDSSIASVDENTGEVTGIKAGTTYITATTDNGLSDKCQVTVECPEPSDISVSPTSQTIKAGDTFTLTYTITPSNAETTLTWTSDDETIATVSSEGVVTGLQKGQTFINVKTENGKTAYCKLTVTAAEPADITLPNTATLYVGETITLTPTITPEDAETTLTWASDDESIVRVDANGVLTGVAEGLALVTVSTANGHVSNACKVKVEIPSGISDIQKDENADASIYNISGQRLVAPKKGINIVDGKKVFMK